MVSWLHEALACAQREIEIVARRPWEVFAVVLAPFMWMGLTWGLLGSGLPTQLPVALADFDDSQSSREVTMVMAATRSVAFVPMATLPDARAALVDGRVYGVVHIPAGYERALKRGERDPVVVYLNEQYFPAVSALEQDMRKAINAVEQHRLAQLAARNGGGFSVAKARAEMIQPAFTSLGNAALNYQAYLGSTLLPGLLQLFAVMAFIGAIAREYREKTVSRWLAATHGRVFAALCGKLAPFLMLYLGYGALYVAWVGGFGGWAPSGSTALWVLATSLLVLAMLAIGVLFAALAPDWRLALTLGSLYVAPALAFSGFSFPLESMSQGARLLGTSLPITWYFKAQAQQWTLASPLEHAVTALSVLLAFAVLPWLVAAPLLARKLPRMARLESAREAA